MASDYEKFLWKETESEDLSQRAHAYWHLAEYSLHSTEYNVALGLNETAQENYTKAGDAEGMAMTRIQHARILAALGEYDQAIEELEACSLEERANPSQTKLAEIISIEGHVYLEKNDVDRAIDCFRQSIELYKSEDEYDETLRVSVQLSTLLRDHDRAHEAFEIIEGAKEAALQDDDARSQAEYEFERGQVLTEIGRRDEAIEALEGAASSFEFLDMKPRSQMTRARLAHAYNRFGEYGKAIEFSKANSEDLVRHSRTIAGAAKLRLDYSYESAYAHSRLGNFEKAKKICKESINVARTLGRKGVQVRFLKLQGWMAEQEFELETAERVYREAIEVNCHRAANRKRRALKLSLAGIYIEAQRGRETIDLLETFDIYQWGKADLEKRQTYFTLLMHAYWYVGNSENAATLAKVVLENQLIEGVSSPSACAAHNMLSVVYENWNQLEKAREHGLKALAMAIEFGNQPLAQDLSKRWLS